MPPPISSAGAGRQPHGTLGTNWLELGITRRGRTGAPARRKDGRGQPAHLVRIHPQALPEVPCSPVHIVGYRMGSTSG